MNTDRSPADPRIYMRIAADLRAKILDGTLAPGQPVPSIKYLSQDWDTDRHSAAKALQLLTSEGLLKRYPGPAGYRVTHSPDSTAPHKAGGDTARTPAPDDRETDR